jgi:hypothetical protein
LIHPALPNLINILSVPEEINVIEVLINNDPDETFGIGTSLTCVLPVFKD